MTHEDAAEHLPAGCEPAYRHHPVRGFSLEAGRGRGQLPPWGLGPPRLWTFEVVVRVQAGAPGL